MASVTSWTAAQIQAAINSINATLSTKADLTAAGGLLVEAQLPADVIVTSSLNTALATKADLSGGVLPDTQAPAISVKKGDLLINAKDAAYGATGNGSTSDDAAILAAIAAVPAGRGGIVYLPAGNYLVSGSTAFTLSTVGTNVVGAGPEATKIVISSSFSATSLFKITADDCSVRNLSIVGQSTTTTSNPVSDGIVTTARRTILDVLHFWYLNGWAIQDTASSTVSTEYPDGSMIGRIVTRYCAGGVRVLGNSISGYAVNTFISDIQNIQCGVATGASANLDGIRIEDAWDVLINNAFSWTANGLGHSLHVVGNCAATFIQTLDALGPSGASCVLVEDGPNGSPQNVQIDGGVIQQGTSGFRVTGGANQVHLRSIRFISNNSHGVSVEGTGSGIHFHDLFFSGNGAGASGTNYDINWTGSSSGYIGACRFGTSLVASGTAGVQYTLNLPASNTIRILDAMFVGTGASSANWYTNAPSCLLEIGAGNFDFMTTVTMSAGLISKANMALQPSTQSNVVMSANTGGSSTYDTWRLDGNGKLAIGPGGNTGTRDTSTERLGAALWGSNDSDIVANLAGKGFRIKEGSNARMGTATLSAGAVTVSNTSVTANTRIVLACKTPGGTVGALFVAAVTVGTSFQIKSTSSTDTSVVGYVLFEAA